MENTDSKITDSSKSLVLYYGASYEICQILPTNKYNQVIAMQAHWLVICMLNFVIHSCTCVAFLACYKDKLSQVKGSA